LRNSLQSGISAICHLLSARAASLHFAPPTLICPNIATCVHSAQDEIECSKSSFGALPDGTAVDLFTLTNAHGLVAKITNYGTIITELHVPDRIGQLADVVLGFNNLELY